MVFGEITVVGLVVLVGVALGLVVNVWIAAVTVRRDVPVARVFSALVLATVMLCVASVAMYLAPTSSIAFGAYVFHTLFGLSGAVLFVLFTIVYTGHRDWLTRRRVALLAIEPVAFVLLMATNPLHGLVLTVDTATFEGLMTLHARPTALGTVHLLYTLGLTTAGYALFVRFYLRARNVYRTQAAVIFLGSIPIPVTSFLYAGGVTPIDLTPFALVLNAVVVWVALFRYDFLDVVPLAADLLIEEMEDAVVVTGADGEILDANGAAERLFAPSGGPGSGAGLVGRSVADVSPSLAETMDGSELFVHPTGTDASRTFDPSVTSIRDQFGIRRGTLLVLHDVTEQVRRQAELENQNERLEAFASVVSHDLRNPLSIAEGYVDLAREEDDTSHLERAADAIDRMNVLVEDLLTLARDGRSIDEVEPVSLASVVDAAWENVGGDATLVNEAEGRVRADPQRLQQLFENLFRNSVEHGSTSSRPKADDAVEHTEPGVTIRVGREDGGFFVEDDGPGIPIDERDRVFDHGYSSSTSSGTGLGLAIVRTIARAHGWSVRLVESRDGGARFEFTDVITPRTVGAQGVG